MAWKGIVGQNFTAETFPAYVAGLKWGAWRPSFTVLHNTAAPTLTQWHGPTPAAQRIKNLESFYRDQRKWSAGPHLFVADDFIWVFTSLTTSGVHSPSWNSISWGIEMVGDYDVEPFSVAVRDNAVLAIAALHASIGLEASALRLHKEDPKTTHKNCPGKNVNKSDMITRISGVMSNLHFGEHKRGV